MLVLDRKSGERVVIGGRIIVTVLKVRGGRVKLGFVGPVEVSIHREEVQPETAAVVPVSALSACSQVA